MPAALSAKKAWPHPGEDTAGYSPELCVNVTLSGPCLYFAQYFKHLQSFKISTQNQLKCDLTENVASSFSSFVFMRKKHTCSRRKSKNIYSYLISKAFNTLCPFTELSDGVGGILACHSRRGPSFFSLNDVIL